jgi:hypothetical protein
MRLSEDGGLMDRLYERLTDALRSSRHEPFAAPVTVAEIYQELVPYRTVREDIGFSMNADYEHALLRLLAGEGERLKLEPSTARDVIARELKSSNPNVSIYREYAGCDVWVRPPAGSTPTDSSREQDSGLGWLDTIDYAEMGTAPFAFAEPVEGEVDAPAAPAAGPRAGGASAAAPRDAPRTPAAGAPPGIGGAVAAASAKVGGVTAAPAEVRGAAAAPAEVRGAAAPAEVRGVGAAPGDVHPPAAGLASARPAAGPASARPAAGPTDAGPAAGPRSIPASPPARGSAAADSAATPTAGASDMPAEPVRCVFCDSDLPSRRAVRFCPYCGGDQTMRPCAACGDALEAGWSFCVACGAAADAG